MPEKTLDVEIMGIHPQPKDLYNKEKITTFCVFDENNNWMDIAYVGDLNPGIDFGHKIRITYDPSAEKKLVGKQYYTQVLNMKKID